MKKSKEDPSSIGNILLQLKLVTQEQIDAVMREQKSMQEDILMGNLMVAKGWITREQLSVALAAQKGMRHGGKNGQALAIADLSLERARRSGEQRERVAQKAASAADALVKLLPDTGS